MATGVPLTAVHYLGTAVAVLNDELFTRTTRTSFAVTGFAATPVTCRVAIDVSSNVEDEIAEIVQT